MRTAPFCLTNGICSGPMSICTTLARKQNLFNVSYLYEIKISHFYSIPFDFKCNCALVNNYNIIYPRIWDTLHKNLSVEDMSPKPNATFGNILIS